MVILLGSLYFDLLVMSISLCLLVALCLVTQSVWPALVFVLCQSMCSLWFPDIFGFLFVGILDLAFGLGLDSGFSVNKRLTFC